MDEHATTIAGIVIPSTSPLFLAIVAAHVLIALVAVIAGAAAMRSVKGPGLHARFGTLYVWALLGAWMSASALAVLRWRQDWHLFLIGLFACVSALVARRAVRGARRGARVHLVGMACSYVLLLVAFYVDNGPQLPLWRALPPPAHWLIPSAVGALVAVRAFLRHPLTRRRPDGSGVK